MSWSATQDAFLLKYFLFNFGMFLSIVVVVVVAVVAVDAVEQLSTGRISKSHCKQ